MVGSAHPCAQNVGWVAEKWSQAYGHQLLPPGVLEGSLGRAAQVCRGGYAQTRDILVHPRLLPFGGWVEGAHGGLLHFSDDIRVFATWISSFVNTFSFL